MPQVRRVDKKSPFRRNNEVIDVTNKAMDISCESCRGTGQLDKYDYTGERKTHSYKCPFCHGTGKIRVVTKR